MNSPGSTLLSPPEPPPRRSRAPLVAALAVVVAAGLGFAAWRLTRPEPARPPRPPRPSSVTKASPPPARPTPPPSASPLREASPRPERATRPAPLRVEADVADASVFVDRRFVGKAPVDLRDLPPGPHRLHVSADGYAMHAEEVEIGTESRTISVRFTEIRLDESVAVVHKHAVGSCLGVMKASTQGLAFEAASGKDSFRVPFPDLAKFEVDYLKKILRVSLKGGRSYNFTVEGESADPILAFHQKVEAVRKRL